MFHLFSPVSIRTSRYWSSTGSRHSKGVKILRIYLLQYFTVFFFLILDFLYFFLKENSSYYFYKRYIYKTKSALGLPLLPYSNMKKETMQPLYN
jgi:hypothetical protein